MIGQFFGFSFVFYIILAAALVPVIGVDSYLRNRDCKVLHGVDRCVIEYVPFTQEVAP
jgi:hypothetical protein